MVGLLFAFMPVLAGSRGGTSDQMDVVRLLVRCATSRCKSHFILFPKKTCKRAGGVTYAKALYQTA